MSTSRRKLLLAGAAASGVAASLSMAAPQERKLRPRQHRVYVDGPHGQLHATITEPATRRATAPPVICLPMSPRSGRDFDEFALTLADRRRVIAPDVPGFGGSDAPAAPPAIEDYAAALLQSLPALLEPRSAARPFDLVGQHTGAAIAVAIARLKASAVRRIATIGVPMFDNTEREQLRALYVRPRPFFEDPQFLCRTWQRDVAAVDAGQSRERMLLRFTEIMRAGLRSHWGFAAVFNYDMRRALTGLPQPFLSIVLAENLAAASREAASLVARGEIADLGDLPGSALDTAHQRLAVVCRDFFDR